MATAAHCLFCFETLAAHLERREALNLDEVQRTYGDFVAAQTGAAAKGGGGGDAAKPKQLPALRRLAGDETLAPASGSASTSSGASSASASTTSLSPATYAATAATSATSLGSAPAETPLFVTWNTTEDEDEGEHVLRGCIGTFEALPLAEGLSSYALTAALHDTRFRPVARRELPYLQVAVTLLTDFEPAEGGAEDWELGTHGLRISFKVGGRRYGATYLPDVAPEQGWTKEETLVSLMRKAGWSGRRDRWRDVDLNVVRYQGKKHSLSYAEYKQWRDWVDNKA